MVVQISISLEIVCSKLDLPILRKALFLLRFLPVASD
jgi:hypothetical protein